MKDCREVSLLQGRVLRSQTATACGSPDHRVGPVTAAWDVVQTRIGATKREGCVLLLVTWVLLACVGFVLHGEMSGIPKSERNVHELLGMGSSGEPWERDRELQRWGNGKLHGGRNRGADVGGGQGPPKPAVPFSLINRHFPALKSFPWAWSCGFSGQ